MKDTAIANSPPAHCPECGRLLASGAPGGLCPACLMQRAVAAPVTAPCAPSDAASAPAPVTEARDYEILGVIAHGGMGVVYRARQRKLNRLVALKMILSGHFALPGEVERFRIEAEAAAQLDHPGIVPIYEVGEAGGRHYFTMKLVEGGSLASQLEHGPLPPRRAAEWVAKVARAAHYAHQRGILHRDIKPTNILLDERGEPLLGDFGLARMLHQDSRLTQSVAVLGSANYMAPEQARGQARQLTTAADIYGLGAVLFEALTGRPPFQGETMMETLQRVVQDEPPKPSQLNPAVDRDLETICLKCLEKEPAARYHSAEELALDLERWLRREPVSARPVKPLERLAKWARRRPAIAGLSAGLVAVTFAGLLAVVYQWRQAEAARAKAEASTLAEATAHAPVISARRILRSDFSARHTVLLPDAVHAVLPGPGGLGLWDLRRQTNLLQFEGAAGSVAAISLTPDGRRLVALLHTNAPSDLPVRRLRQTTFLSYDLPLGQTVNVWAVPEGRRLLAFAPGANAVMCARLSADGRRLATAHYDGTVELRKVPEGELLWRRQAHNNTVAWVEFSPDGRRLATGAHSEQRMINGLAIRQEPIMARVYDADTGKELLALENRVRYGLTRSLGHGDGYSVPVFTPDGGALLTLAAQPINLALWQAGNGARLAALGKGRMHLSSVAFSPDGRWFVMAAEGPGLDGQPEFTARVCERQTGRCRQILRGHTQPLLGVEFSPDGRRVLTWSADQTLRLWDPLSGVGLAVLRGHEAPIRSAIFSPDGLEIISIAEDQTLRVWPAATLEQLAHKLQFHTQAVAGLVFSPDSRRLASGGSDARLAVWDALAGRLLASFNPGEGLPAELLRHGTFSLSHLQFDASGRRLFAGMSEPQIRVHTVDVTMGAGQVQPRQPVRVYDFETGLAPRALEGFPYPLEALAVSHNGRYAAMLPGNTTTEFRFGRFTKRILLRSDFIKGPRQAYLWDLQAGQIVAKLGPVLENSFSIAFSPDDRRLLVSSWDAVQIYEVATGRLATNLLSRYGADYAPLKYAREAWWTADGTEVVVNQDIRIGVWNPATGRPARQLPKASATFDQVRFFPELGVVDGVTLDGHYYRWDLASGRELRHFSGRPSSVEAAKHLHDSVMQGEVAHWRNTRALMVAWSADGELLATRQVDREVEVWSTATGRRLARLTGHTGYVSALAFSPDGRWLASGDTKGLVRVWPVSAMLAMQEHWQTGQE